MNLSLGAALIIAGTTVGAGMLAIPIAMAPLGFGASLSILIFWWAIMLYSAMLVVRLNRICGEAITLPLLFRYFGLPKAEHLLGFVLCFLYYALIAAYLTGASSILHSMLPDHLSKMIPIWGIITILGLVFSVLILSHRIFSDLVNRILIAIKISAFVIMYIKLLPSLSLSNLKASDASPSNMLLAIPIIFASFGFHGSIASVLKYAGIRSRSVFAILFWGSLLPCLLYILWILASMGTIPQVGPHSFATVKESGQDLGVLLDILSHISQSPSLIIASSVFSLLAIATSLLGVGMGLYDFFEERMRGRFQKFYSILATFLIPFLFAQFYPNGFIMALGLASIALALLALIFPAYLCLKLGDKFPLYGAYEKWLIRLLLLLGLGIIAIECIHLMQTA